MTLEPNFESKHFFKERFGSVCVQYCLFNFMGYFSTRQVVIYALFNPHSILYSHCSHQPKKIIPYLSKMLNSSNMAGFFTKSISQIIGSSYYNKTPETGSQYILGTSPPDGSMELYILDNKLQVCSCPREKIPLLCHSIIRMALLPDSRLVILFV